MPKAAGCCNTELFYRKYPFPENVFTTRYVEVFALLLSFDVYIVKSIQSSEVRNGTHLISETLLSGEHQKALYERFIVSGAEDELNLPANISKPLRTAFNSHSDESLGDLWTPVYKEVVKMVLTNCFPALIPAGRSNPSTKTSALMSRASMSQMRGPPVLKTAVDTL